MEAVGRSDDFRHHGEKVEVAVLVSITPGAGAEQVDPFRPG